MVVTSFTEMSVIIYHSAWHHIPNDRCDNIKLHVINTDICEMVIAVNLSIFVKCQQFLVRCSFQFYLLYVRSDMISQRHEYIISQVFCTVVAIYARPCGQKTVSSKTKMKNVCSYISVPHSF